MRTERTSNVIYHEVITKKVINNKLSEELINVAKNTAQTSEEINTKVQKFWSTFVSQYEINVKSDFSTTNEISIAALRLNTF